MSDNGSDDNDNDDPHKALSNIVLDDILEDERAKTEKKPKKKKKADADLNGAVGLDISKSPELVEHKVHKQKKKKKSKKSSKTTAEEDLLGLSLDVNTNNESVSDILLIGSNDNIKVEVNKTEVTIEEVKLQMNVTFTNIGSDKLSQVSICPTNITSPVTSQHITKSLKPGKDYCQARVQVQGLSQISNKRPGPGACSYNCNVTHPPENFSEHN